MTQINHQQENYNISNHSLLTVLVRHIYERRLPVNDADEEQSVLYKEIKRTKPGKTPDEKENFFKKLDFFLMIQKKFF